MTMEEIVAVINQQFASPQALAVALQLLDARMGIELANGAQRIAQAQAEVAQATAQQAIQQAQAQAAAAQARFDLIVAGLANSH